MRRIIVLIVLTCGFCTYSFGENVTPPAGSPRFLTLPFSDLEVSLRQGWYYDVDVVVPLNCPHASDIVDAVAKRPHCGIDYINGPVGDRKTFEVVAAANGCAIRRESTSTAGTYVTIEHDATTPPPAGKKFFTRYLHLDPGLVNPNIPTFPAPCVQIDRGDPIGWSGNSGIPGEAIHLHFDVVIGGIDNVTVTTDRVDPYDIAIGLLESGTQPTKEFYPPNTSFISCGDNHLWTACPPSLIVDTTPPILTDFTFDPTTIDVNAGPASVTATLQLTDDLSGATSANITFNSPSFGQFQTGTAFLAAGTPQNGTFVGVINFPQFAESGTWTVTNVFLRDRVGNASFVSTAVLQDRMFPTELEVLSTTDDQAPAITGLSILPNAVDVSSADQSVTLSLELTDNLSGVAFAPEPGDSCFCFFPVSVTSPSGQQTRFLGSGFASDFALVSGTPTNGVWEGTFSMPQFSEPGTWKISFIRVRDVTGNFSFDATTDLEAAGFSVDLEVTSTPADTSLPVLTGLRLLPTVINTSASNQAVSVEFDIVDDLAGADFSTTTAHVTTFEAGLNMRSPSGNQSRSIICCASLIAGTPLAGTWQSSLFFPQFSEDGTWRITALRLKDATRNIRVFDGAELEAMGFPTELVVLRPSLIGDGSVDSSGGTVVDDTFGDRAQVSFPPGAVLSTTDVAIDVFLEPLDIPNPAGFTGLGTLFVNIELTPEPNFPLPPPGLTVVLPLPNPLPAGTSLDLFKVDPATGSLVPTLDVFGLPVTGIVSLDGLSAVFSGISSLSTVVGLIPDVITVEDLIGRVEALAANGSLNARLAKPLLVKLANAQQDLDRGHFIPALNKLGALTNNVNAFIRGRKLSEDDGQSLIADIQRAIEFLLMEKTTLPADPAVQEGSP